MMTTLSTENVATYPPVPAVKPTHRMGTAFVSLKLNAVPAAPPSTWTPVTESATACEP